MLIIRHSDQLADLEPSHPARARADLLYLAPILIIEPGDTEADIINEIGFSPLVNLLDGERFPSPAFTPNWEWIELSDGWFEQVYVTCDDGSGVMIFVPDDARVDADLIALCRQ